MSTVRYFRWDDPGAPTLSGQVGSLTNLLRKCLVGTAGVAYGSKPSAGWTEEFVGAASNIAVFRNNESEGGCGCCVRINDNAPGGGGAREARINVYATMSDINTGTNGTSTTYFRKSSALSSTARKWLIVADERTAWVYCFQTGDSEGGANYDKSVASFGDIENGESVASAHRYYALGRSDENISLGGTHWCFSAQNTWAYPSLQVAVSTGLSAPVTCITALGLGSMGIGGSSYPETLNGNKLFFRFPMVYDSTRYPRGFLRGIYSTATRSYQMDPGELILGSDRLIAVTGAAQYSSGAGYAFGVALDVVGPW